MEDDQLKKHRATLIALTLLAALILVPAETRSGMNDSGVQRIRTIDLKLDPVNTANASYTICLANGKVIEGTAGSWVDVDRMLRLCKELVRGKTAVFVNLKDGKNLGFLTRVEQNFQSHRKAIP